MLKKNGKTRKRLIFTILLVFIVALFGCADDGDDGAKGATGAIGPAGPAGPPGSAGSDGSDGSGSAVSIMDAASSTPEDLAKLMPNATIKSVTISSPPVVQFTVTDSNARGITGLEKFSADDDRFFRFTLAKLVSENDGQTKWVPYVISSGSPSYDSARSGGVLTAKGSGTYTYTFATDITAVEGVTYEPTLTHRLGGQIGNSTAGLEPMNMVYDFVPPGGVVTATRNIAMTASCNECHDPLNIHGRRFEVGYCVTCHNPTIGDENLAPMIHKVHTAQMVGDHDFTEVTYPQDVRNCRKCHSGDDAETPDGDNWKNKPSMIACGACHTDANFATGTEHEGGIQSDNRSCSMCHDAEQIEKNHVTPNASPNNPNLPSGVPNIEYKLIKASVNAKNQAVITFSILRDGNPINLLNLGADMAAPNRWPDFILAYAQAQDGIAEPAEYNNRGNSSAQPITVDLDQLGPVNNDDGTMVANGDGTFTATTGGTTFAEGVFPAGASMRAVALQGYFQVDVDGDGSSDYSLHTPSAVIAAAGDTARREVVDSNKCGSCHEWFEGHGGGRVFNMNVCVFCHNPNLSSSGREIAEPDARVTAVYGEDALSYPEATNNFKDMIHGIHGGENRTTDYQFVRNRNNGYPYNWSEVTFPGRANNCMTCHKEGTYELPIAENTLLTTNRTTGVGDGKDANVAAVSDAQDSVPNDTDWVITPNAATCFACHDSRLAEAHMKHNGAAINENRSTVMASNYIESCAICHGVDKTADMNKVHGF